MQTPPGSSLRFSVMRQLLRQKERYNQSIRPFLQSLHSHTHNSIGFIPPSLMSVLRSPDGSRFLTMQEAMRRDNASIQAGLEALSAFRLLDRRLQCTSHKDLVDVPYTLQVGDVVKHTQLGQMGVVAARLPVCLEDDEWVKENLGSLEDPRMSQPWYLVLVAPHAGLPMDFMRYGSQLTHEKLLVPRSIGFHRALPIYFKGFNKESGYLPRRRPPGSTVESVPVPVQTPPPATEEVDSSIPSKAYGYG